MADENLHQREVGEQTVWIKVQRPAVFDVRRNQYVEGGFIVAFKIGAEPQMIDGEYVKEGGKPKFFEDKDTAVSAALEEARRRIANDA